MSGSRLIPRVSSCGALVNYELKVSVEALESLNRLDRYTRQQFDAGGCSNAPPDSINKYPQTVPPASSLTLS